MKRRAMPSRSQAAILAAPMRQLLALSVRTRRMATPCTASQARCAGEKAGTSRSALVEWHLGVGQAGVVVDGDVDVVPAHAAAAHLLAAAVDTPAAAVGHPAEFLDVDVQQVAGV
jgi:hypothetical protein